MGTTEFLPSTNKYKKQANETEDARDGREEEKKYI